MCTAVAKPKLEATASLLSLSSAVDANFCAAPSNRMCPISESSYPFCKWPKAQR